MNSILRRRIKRNINKFDEENQNLKKNGVNETIQTFTKNSETKRDTLSFKKRLKDKSINGIFQRCVKSTSYDDLNYDDNKCKLLNSLKQEKYKKLTRKYKSKSLPIRTKVKIFERNIFKDIIEDSTFDVKYVELESNPKVCAQDIEVNLPTNTDLCTNTDTEISSNSEECTSVTYIDTICTNSLLKTEDIIFIDEEEPCDLDDVASITSLLEDYKMTDQLTEQCETKMELFQNKVLGYFPKTRKSKSFSLEASFGSINKDLIRKCSGKKFGKEMRNPVSKTGSNGTQSQKMRSSYSDSVLNGTYQFFRKCKSFKVPRKSFLATQDLVTLKDVSIEEQEMIDANDFESEANLKEGCDFTTFTQHENTLRICEVDETDLNNDNIMDTTDFEDEANLEAGINITTFPQDENTLRICELDETSLKNDIVTDKTTTECVDTEKLNSILPYDTYCPYYYYPTTIDNSLFTSQNNDDKDNPDDNTPDEDFNIYESDPFIMWEDENFSYEELAQMEHQCMDHNFEDEDSDESSSDYNMYEENPFQNPYSFFNGFGLPCNCIQAYYPFFYGNYFENMVDFYTPYYLMRDKLYDFYEDFYPEEAEIEQGTWFDKVYSPDTSINDGNMSNQMDRRETMNEIPNYSRRRDRHFDFKETGVDKNSTKTPIDFEESIKNADKFWSNPILKAREEYQKSCKMLPSMIEELKYCRKRNPQKQNLRLIKSEIAKIEKKFKNRVYRVNDVYLEDIEEDAEEIREEQGEVSHLDCNNTSGSDEGKIIVEEYHSSIPSVTLPGSDKGNEIVKKCLSIIPSVPISHEGEHESYKKFNEDKDTYSFNNLSIKEEMVHSSYSDDDITHNSIENIESKLQIPESEEKSSKNFTDEVLREIFVESFENGILSDMNDGESNQLPKEWGSSSEDTILTERNTSEEINNCNENYVQTSHTTWGKLFPSLKTFFGQKDEEHFVNNESHNIYPPVSLSVD